MLRKHIFNPVSSIFDHHQQFGYVFFHNHAVGYQETPGNPCEEWTVEILVILPPEKFPHNTFDKEK